MFKVQDQQANSPGERGPVDDFPNRLDKEYGKSSITERGDSKEEVEHFHDGGFNVCCVLVLGKHHHQECLVKKCGDHSEAKSEGDS